VPAGQQPIAPLAAPFKGATTGGKSLEFCCALTQEICLLGQGVSQACVLCPQTVCQIIHGCQLIFEMLMILASWCFQVALQA
jgi:hypothetical protein